MSKKKRVICIEKPSIESSVRSITVGKDYKVLINEDGRYYIKDDDKDSYWYLDYYFKDAKPKKKKPKKQKGLTKREYFAAKAMQGMLAGDHGDRHIAGDSVWYADQLIEELNKKKVNEQYNRSGRHCGSH